MCGVSVAVKVLYMVNVIVQGTLLMNVVSIVVPVLKLADVAVQVLH